MIIFSNTIGVVIADLFNGCDYYCIASSENSIHTNIERENAYVSCSFVVYLWEITKLNHGKGTSRRFRYQSQ